MPRTKTKRVKTNVVSQSFFKRVTKKASITGRKFLDDEKRQIQLPARLLPNNGSREILTVKLNKTFKPSVNLVDITVRVWKVNKKRSQNALYLLGVYKDIVVCVFQIKQVNQDKICADKKQFELKNVPYRDKRFLVLKRLRPRRQEKKNPIKYLAI